MNQFRQAIDKRLDLIDFESLSKGFKRYDYALYDDKHVYLKDRVIDKDQRFLGNTAINFEGEYIAIWHNPQGDLDILTSNIIHEMFHCHQYDANIPILIDDLGALKYTLDRRYLELKQEEKVLLVNAIQNMDQDAYSQVLSIRQMRNNLNPIYDYERSIEIFEGGAEACKLSALKHFCYATYEKVIKEGCAFILNEYFDTRRIAYYSGAYLTILENLFPETQGITNYELENKFNLQSAFNDYIASKKEQMKKYSTDVNIKGHICGYDPMNMMGYDNKILHKHFVMIKKETEKLFLQGPLVTVYDEDPFEVVTVLK